MWVSGVALGDVTEPACVLDVTAVHLRGVLRNLEQSAEADLEQLGDRDAFDLLDQKLYGDDERSNDEIASDGKRFWRFDFLTNGGESFDRTKSFIIRLGDNARILFAEYIGSELRFHAGHVNYALFKRRVEEFLNWLESERDRAG
jgi:hypothetical protein